MDEVTETSIATLMGRRISIHRHDFFTPNGRRGALWAFLGLLFCSLSSFFVMMYLPEIFYEDLWYALAPILFLLGFARMILNATIRQHDQIILHKRGLTFRLRGSAGFCEWDDIELVKHVAKADRDIFTIICQGKPNIVLDEDISEVLALGRAIQDAVRHRLSEAAYEDIQAQREIMFGTLTLSLEGVQFEQETVLWSEIKAVEVVRESKNISLESSVEIEEVIVREVGARQPWIVLPVSKVPNEFVLVDLAERLLASAPGLVREGRSEVKVNEQESP